MTDPRLQAKLALLAEAGWSLDALDPLPADASTRQYSRLSEGGRTALLMDAPPAAEGTVCPPDADEKARVALGYNALARLAGGRMDAFIELSQWLNEKGLRAPTVYGVDQQQGFAVLEDFGDVHLRDVAHKDEAGYYRRALRILRELRQQPVSPGKLGSWCLQTYDNIALQAEADLFLEWYLPHYGRPLNDDAMSSWHEVWSGMFAQLSSPETLVLRDFHAENILVPDGGELAVIDYQDALIGQSAYDVASLLEDARRDVDKDLADEFLLEEAEHSRDGKAFRRDYAILALQRNLKILGVFARLIHRDGKPKYESLLPRVKAHVLRDLGREEVYPVRQWAEVYVPALLMKESRS